MKKIEEYHAEWDGDAQLPDTMTPDIYLRQKHPVVVGKWSRYLSTEKKITRILEIEIDRLRATLQEYYASDLNDHPDELEKLGRGPNLKRVLKEQIPIKIAEDKDMIRVLTKLAGQQEKVDFLNGVKKELEFRPSALKTALDYMRWEGGR